MNETGKHQQAWEGAFRQVVAHRTMLKAYLLAIVRDHDLAESTLSDVAVAIAHSWERYDKSRPFPQWARGVARRVALANLRKHRTRPVQLDTDLLDILAIELDSIGNETYLEMRKQTLRKCLKKLSKTNTRLVRLRYFEDCTYKEIAHTLKRSIKGLYVVFNRIHKFLSSCVQDRMAESA